LESQERSIYDRKQQIKDALAAGKQLPTELRTEARTLGKDLVLDEAQVGELSTSPCTVLGSEDIWSVELVLFRRRMTWSEAMNEGIITYKRDVENRSRTDRSPEPRNHVDDEYAKVGTYDPKIVITTSRSPSSRLLQFSKVSISTPFAFNHS
jgi:U3 small nucleolar ribonucleoprotein protein IMP4